MTEPASRRRGYLVVLPWEPVSSSGVNQVVLNLLRECERSEDLRPLLLIQRWEFDRPQEERVGEQTYIRLRGRSPSAEGSALRSLMYYAAFLPRELSRLSRLLAAHSVTVVNVHYPSLSATSFALLRRLRLYKGGLSLSFHGLDLKTAAQARGWRRRLWGWLGRNVDAITACSAALAADVTATFPEWRDKVRVVHNGLDMQSFRGQTNAAVHPDAEVAGRRYLLCVAGFEPKKGQDTLVRAFAMLAQRFPELLLVMIGGPGPMREPLVSLARELGLGSRVIFRDSLDHARMAAYFRDAAAFALPSRSEPFGIVLLEAGAFALPVVASRVGGIPEIITSADFGLLVEPDDPAALSNALNLVLTEPEKARVMGERLQERVGQEFSWSKAFRAYVQYGTPAAR